MFRLPRNPAAILIVLFWWPFAAIGLFLFWLIFGIPYVIGRCFQSLATGGRK